MNICFLTAEIPNLRSGGIENVTFRLANEFTRRGYKVHCLTLDSAPKAVTTFPFKHTCIGKQGDVSAWVADYISNNKIEVLINQSIELRCQDIVSKIKSQTPKCKFVKTLHTDPSYMIKGVIDAGELYINDNVILRFLDKISPITIIRKLKRKKYTKSLYSSWIDLYDRIVLLSENIVDDFKRLAGRIDSQNLVAISNPIDFRIPQSCEASKEKLVLFVGRMHKEAKRPDRMLAIWNKIYKHFPEWKLVFIGDGPMRPALETYSKAKGFENVVFTGQINPTTHFKAASILCITSTYEGFPLVCGEALSHGVIPIAFASFGAVKDLIRNGNNGFLIKPYSINDYAKILSSLMADPDHMASLRKNILSDDLLQYSFSMNTIANKWESLFNELREE